ncbi:MAG: hypothetical protein M3367_12885 [Acidobacteriota bacterium]|nr:hypothetical protein [Acidobacteriota bacterium]
MNTIFLTLRTVFITGTLLSFLGTAAAQTVTIATATESSGEIWKIQLKFDKSVTPGQIKDINVFNPEKGTTVPIGKPGPTTFGDIYEVFINSPLETITSPQTKKPKLKSYILNIKVEDADGNVDWQNIKLELPKDAPVNTVIESKAEDIDDADVYIDGEANGAFKRKTAFSTNIKLQKLKRQGDWKYTPYGFFKLNASTAPDADPDSMEFGFNFRYIFSSPFYWDNEAKIESERDFDNTNFIYSSRIIYTPSGKTLVRLNQANGETKSVQIFFRPFIGTELGKNLRSPLDAAEGGGIARLLIGADVRLNFPINKENGRDIDWRTSYTRRWLLTDELGFEADDGGNLQLNRFGKSPRDYLKSKANFGFNKFFGAFIEYDWGQVPPSYKLVDHRFRLGLFYKYKFGIK